MEENDYAKIELRKVTTKQRKIGDLFWDILKLSWIFNKNYEKVLLSLIVFWGLYAFYRIYWVGCGCILQ